MPLAIPGAGKVTLRQRLSSVVTALRASPMAMRVAQFVAVGLVCYGLGSVCGYLPENWQGPCEALVTLLRRFR